MNEQRADYIAIIKDHLEFAKIHVQESHAQLESPDPLVSAAQAIAHALIALTTLEAIRGR